MLASFYSLFSLSIFFLFFFCYNFLILHSWPQPVSNSTFNNSTNLLFNSIFCGVIAASLSERAVVARSQCSDAALNPDGRRCEIARTKSEKLSLNAFDCNALVLRFDLAVSSSTKNITDLGFWPMRSRNRKVFGGWVKLVSSRN